MACLLFRLRPIGQEIVVTHPRFRLITAVFGTLLAVLVLGERVSALSWLGIALVIAATAVAVVAPKLLEKRQSA